MNKQKDLLHDKDDCEISNLFTDDRFSYLKPFLINIIT